MKTASFHCCIRNATRNSRVTISALLFSYPDHQEDFENVFGQQYLRSFMQHTHHLMTDSYSIRLKLFEIQQTEIKLKLTL